MHLKPNTYLCISQELLKGLLFCCQGVHKDERRIMSTVVFNAIEKLRSKTDWKRKEV